MKFDDLKRTDLVILTEAISLWAKHTQPQREDIEFCNKHGYPVSEWSLSLFRDADKIIEQINRLNKDWNI